MDVSWIFLFKFCIGVFHTTTLILSTYKVLFFKNKPCEDIRPQMINDASCWQHDKKVEMKIRTWSDIIGE